MANTPPHLLQGLDEAVERVRKAPLIEKGQAAEVAFSALRSVLAQLVGELAAVRAQLDEHQRRGH